MTHAVNRFFHPLPDDDAQIRMGRHDAEARATAVAQRAHPRIRQGIADLEAIAADPGGIGLDNLDLIRSHAAAIVTQTLEIEEAYKAADADQWPDDDPDGPTLREAEDRACDHF